MKTIKNILLFSIIMTSAFGFSQTPQTPTIATTKDPENAPFVGTWEYQDGDQIFRLHISEANYKSFENDYFVSGDYEMVQIDASGQETLIYTSVPNNFPNWPGAFRGVVHTNGILGGSFKEMHIGSSGINGSFAIELVPSCLTCPDKIRWKVTEGRGLRLQAIGAPERPDHYVVPSNIVLEKVPES